MKNFEKFIRSVIKYKCIWHMDIRKGIVMIQKEGKRFDEMGVFLPLEHFSDRLERHIEKADQIVYGK